MSLDSEIKDFKMPDGTGHNLFFHVVGAEQWDFYNYFQATHNNINKFKNYQTIRNDYLDDIERILRTDVPKKIKSYVTELKNNIVKYQNLTLFSMY